MTIVEKKHIKAMDKFYHKEHFNCAVCSVDLSEVPVYTRLVKRYKLAFRTENILCLNSEKTIFIARVTSKPSSWPNVPNAHSI